MLTFSGGVQAYIDTLEWEEDRGLTPQERQEAAKGQRLVEGIVSELINSRETLTEVVEAINPHERLTNSRLKDLVKLAIEKLVETEPDLVKDWLDEYYTRELVDAVPGYVSRTLEFSRMEARRVPSKVRNTYVREATRAYIMGCLRRASPCAVRPWNRA